MEVAPNEQGRALDSGGGAVQQIAAGAPDTRRVAEAGVPIALLPPGDYVARAVVSVAGRKVGQVTAVPDRPRGRHADRHGAKRRRARRHPRPAIAFTSRIDAFEQTSVLSPQVVGFFLDRMNVRQPRRRAAGRDRGGARRQVRRGDRRAAARAPQRARAGVPRGPRAVRQRRAGAAAGKFRDALRIDSEFFPAAFYLGACYAAGGRDRDAVGAWQTSLMTESERAVRLHAAR